MRSPFDPFDNEVTHALRTLEATRVPKASDLFLKPEYPGPREGFAAMLRGIGEIPQIQTLTARFL
jgi:hypothetical protein